MLPTIVYSLPQDRTENLLPITLCSVSTTEVINISRTFNIHKSPDKRAIGCWIEAMALYHLATSKNLSGRKQSSFFTDVGDHVGSDWDDWSIRQQYS